MEVGFFERFADTRGFKAFAKGAVASNERWTCVRAVSITRDEELVVADDTENDRWGDRCEVLVVAPCTDELAFWASLKRGVLALKAVGLGVPKGEKMTGCKKCATEVKRGKVAELAEGEYFTCECFG